MLKLAGEIIEGQLADHLAELDAHNKNMFDVGRIGEYLLLSYANSAGALTANQLYAAFFPVSRDMTFDRIAIKVTTLATDKSCRLGIYQDDGNWAPGALLLDAGEMSVATTGVKTITINQQLTKGIYWLAVVSDGAPTLLGKSVLTPVHNLSGGDPMPGWARAFTYAALPDPVGGTPSLNKYSSWVWLRLASLD